MNLALVAALVFFGAAAFFSVFSAFSVFSDFSAFFAFGLAAALPSLEAGLETLVVAGFPF